MNSTLRSLLFWVVLVVIGVLIWNFSTKFQQHDQTITFTQFMSWADSGSVAQGLVVSGFASIRTPRSWSRLPSFSYCVGA